MSILIKAKIFSKKLMLNRHIINVIVKIINVSLCFEGKVAVSVSYVKFTLDLDVKSLICLLLIKTI